MIRTRINLPLLCQNQRINRLSDLIQRSMIEFVLSSSSAEHSVRNIIIKYLKLTYKFNFSITFVICQKDFFIFFSCSIVQKMKSLLSSDMTVILIQCFFFFFFSFFFCFSSHLSNQISGTNGDKLYFGTSYII